MLKYKKIFQNIMSMSKRFFFYSFSIIYSLKEFILDWLFEMNSNALRVALFYTVIGVLDRMKDMTNQRVFFSEKIFSSAYY